MAPPSIPEPAVAAPVESRLSSPTVNERLRQLLALELDGEDLAAEEAAGSDEDFFDAGPFEGEPVSPEAVLAARPRSEAQEKPAAIQVAQAQPPAQPVPPTLPEGVLQRDGDRVRILANGITLEGNEVEFHPETGLYELKGNPVATRGADSIRADRMTLNPRTRVATAEGSVLIRQDSQEFRATRATYNFEARSGLAENVETLFGTYYVQAKEVELKPGLLYEGRRVHFSTCPPEHGHYGVYTRVLEAKPGQNLTARNVGFDVFGLRVLTIPRLRKSLREEDKDENEKGGPVYPAFGYSKYFGPYVRREFTLQRSRRLWLDSDVQLNTWHEPQGGVLFATPGRVQVTGSVYYRDNSQNRSVRNMQVSRLPEIGLVWSGRERPRPGQLLTHQIYGVGYSETLENSTRWITLAEASAGYYRQHHGDRVRGSDSMSKNGGRARLQVQGVLPKVDLGRASLNGLRLLARQTFYDNGEKLMVLGTGIGKQVRTGKWIFRADRFDQWTFGSTPFLFDDLELAREWRPKVEYQTPIWSISYTLRLHGVTGNVFDQWFSISKLHHCLQPRITYRTRQSQFLFEIRIPGIGGFGRRSGDAPATIREEDPGARVLPTQQD